jgi:predicted pyridoxine 5'-phosphate oxidase superfamily flavin-nucleotide-binding protein
MSNRFFELMFTPSVQAEQARHGSRSAYARVTRRSGEPGLTDQELEFIAARDSFYLATISETGWPHLQHRGGPTGFVRSPAPDTIAWADFSGNRQYVSIGNTAVEARVALFFMDYPRQRRLKLLGRLSSFEIGERPDLRAVVETPGYRATIEHAVVVEVEAYDWNCPQHITPRYTTEEIDAARDPLSQSDWTRHKGAAEG